MTSRHWISGFLVLAALGLFVDCVLVATAPPTAAATMPETSESKDTANAEDVFLQRNWTELGLQKRPVPIPPRLDTSAPSDDDLSAGLLDAFDRHEGTPLTYVSDSLWIIGAIDDPESLLLEEN